MSKKITITGVLIILGSVFGFNAQAGGNPGKSAMNCLSITKDNNSRNQTKVYLRNRCNKKIFYFYCGDLKYTRKRCGDKANYYTHSNNLRPGQKGSFVLRKGGRYQYGACVGGIGFSNGGTFRSRGGRFTCLKTGSYARNERKRSRDTTTTNNRQNNRYNNNHNNNRYNNNRYNNSYKKRKRTYNMSVYGKNFVPMNRNKALYSAKNIARKQLVKACRRKGYNYVRNIKSGSRRNVCRSGGNTYYGNKFICTVKLIGTCYR